MPTGRTAPFEVVVKDEDGVVQERRYMTPEEFNYIEANVPPGWTVVDEWL